MKLIKRAAVVAAVVVVSGVFIYAASSAKTSDKGYEFTRIPVTIDFAGEKTPLSISDVRERFDRELTVNINLHATTELVIKRANRVFPVIEPILKKNGVPDDFKYLAVIESGLINVTSPSGAKGVWQFMPETAKQFGMEVNDIVDERYHLEKSTELACQYLLKAKAKFGNWTMAAASYNGGMNGMDRFMEAQKVSDYYDLLVNEETSRYVFRILALKEIMQNQQKYGYALPAEILYPQIPTKKIEVTANIDDLATFAIEQGINYKILKIHNPWLRDKKLVIQPGKVYTIEIPLEGYTK
ncbi:membrane-bound lytic murein transglycosylase D precursor [Flavobacterium limnosediminis JC2902]|uniref:Membrane-bound lytic murein transglycosylase D n=1 Tax=Flavobacterium limnosediminis JC2902 TaxID=1341181 RepID=V6SKL1_9FLAO|nr:lytic transglycosylase domain-containing protein [Flavobacterium limnosediminis]ESU26984.1 membrane-bound lytic murein transglycosylase D precursor [Flavobacterium limnosediminis JC2902]